MSTACQERFTARLEGKDADAVPYRKLTESWFDWLDGWKDQDHHLRSRDECLSEIGWNPKGAA